MSTDDNKDYRQQGKTALETVCENKRITNSIEKALYELSQKHPENTYRTYIFQAIGDLTSGVPHKTVLEMACEGKYGWRHNCFDKIREKQKEQDEYITNPYEAEEGVVDCRCGSKRTVCMSQQNRAADEGATVHAFCIQCKRRWKIEG